MEPITIVNGNTLYAVPAIHYRAVFAREVNRLCMQETSRPDAIAVELCPQMVREIAGWMKELGIGPFRENMLPCMLGIMVKNRLIHPDYRDTTLFLQERFKKPLNELSPVLQKQLLHFSDQYLVSLSSTDSIIEAIRCAVELDLPVFGIDMEEFSAGNDQQQLIEDVTGPIFNLSDWVNNNEKTAVLARDPYVDGRREKVMTARLKAILAEYRKVLFTGGLAHWLMIRRLLSDPAIRPAETMISDWIPKYTRTIIHPSLAVMFMDTYPVLTTRYEEGRRNPLTAIEDPSPLSDAGQVCREILTDTYGKYFNPMKSSKLSADQSEENHWIPDFERLLSLVSMVHHHKYPSITDLLEVALSMLPLDLYKLLVSRMMEIGRPWASQEQFPDLPMISFVPFDNKKASYATSDDLFQLTGTRYDDDGNPIYRKKSSPFSANYQAGNRLSKNLMRYWLWGDESKKKFSSGIYNSWVWPPCEALLYGTASAAAKIARSQSREPEPAIFEGSLYDGLDIKASIRSVIKGEKRIYIRRPSSAKKTFIPDGKRPDPTVFIFCSDNQVAGSKWSLWLGGFNIGEHVKNHQRFEEISREKGSSFVASVAYNHVIPVPGNMHSHVDSVTMLDGTTIFGNPCINAKQAAEWVEDNDYQCCPVLFDTTGGIYTLVDFFLRTHHIEIETENWHNALIQLAIPYARERVVIIAPEKFQVSRKLFSEAKRRKIELAVMSLNYFPAEKISEMRRRVLVRAIDSDGCKFPKEVETAMGQTADHYRELLPLYMQQQLNRYD